MQEAIRTTSQDSSFKLICEERREVFENLFDDLFRNNPIYGKIHSFVKKGKQTVFIITEERTSCSLMAHHQVNIVKQLIDLSHLNLITPIDYSVIVETNEIDEKVYIIKAYYRYEVNAKEPRQQNSGDDFIRVCYDMIQAYDFLRSKEINFMNFNHYNIIYDRFEKKARLIVTTDDIQTKLISRSKQRTMQLARMILYYSPISYPYLLNQDFDFTVNFSKENVFYLGFALLEMEFGPDIHHIYSKNEKKVDKEILALYIKRFEEKYNRHYSYIVDKIKEMLVFEEDSRMDFNELSQSFKSLEDLRFYIYSARITERNEREEEHELMLKRVPHITYKENEKRNERNNFSNKHLNQVNRSNVNTPTNRKKIYREVDDRQTTIVKKIKIDINGREITNGNFCGSNIAQPTKSNLERSVNNQIDDSIQNGFVTNSRNLSNRYLSRSR